MSNFTIIKQKLVVIFIIIVFIISSLVFLNSVYNALFVWYDNDNSENVNDINVPISKMFGYKILLNSYVVKGDCTNYNKDIVLTTSINTILFKIYNLIFVFFVLMMFILVIGEYFGIIKTSATMEYKFYDENKNIIYFGIGSALILFMISSIFNNPGKKFYDKYKENESTFENYLYGKYNEINNDEYKNRLKRILKNTNKNNFYQMNIDDYFKENDSKICYNILKLCKELCIINKDTSVDVVKVFSKFIDNCEKSNKNDNLSTDKCIFGEFDFLINNIKSIFSLLWWKDGVSENIDNINNEDNLEIILFSSLLTKEYLKKCPDNKFDGRGDYFVQLGKYTINQSDPDNSNELFIDMMNGAKQSAYFDLFIMKGILTGMIIFMLANIILKKYYNENEYGKKILLEIDKTIILSKIKKSNYDVIKYENIIKPLLKEDNYNVNIVLSIIIILLLLKVIPGYTFPVKTIRFDSMAECSS